MLSDDLFGPGITELPSPGVKLALVGRELVGRDKGFRIRKK